MSAGGQASGVLLSPDADPRPRVLDRQAGSLPSFGHRPDLSLRDAGHYTEQEPGLTGAPVSLTGRPGPEFERQSVSRTSVGSCVGGTGPVLCFIERRIQGVKRQAAECLPGEAFHAVGRGLCPEVPGSG